MANAAESILMVRCPGPQSDNDDARAFYRRGPCQKGRALKIYRDGGYCDKPGCRTCHPSTFLWVECPVCHGESYIEANT